MAFSGTKDLTHGRPLRLVTGFALPLLFGVLFQQLYNFVDTAVVGRYLGADMLGAVVATGSVNFLIVGFCLGICSGFSVPVSQRFGAGDLSEMRRFVMNGVYLAGVFGVIMGVTTAVLCPQILRLMNTPEELMPYSCAYIRVIFAVIPVTMVYNMAAGILRALGDSRTPVIFLIGAALINVGLDLLFILRFNMGVAGAAWATGISQLFSGVGCVAVLVKKFTLLRPEGDEKRISPRHMKTLAGVGLPMGLQFSITAIGTVVVQAAVNALGTASVSAVAAGTKLSMLFTCVYDALSSTMATFAGQNLGAGRPDRINRGLGAACLLGSVYSVAATAVLFLFGESLITLFVDAGETAVIEKAMIYLRFNSALYLPLMAVNVFRLAIQGMGYTRVAMVAGVLEMAARSVVALLMVPLYGYSAVCAANPAAWVAADLFLIPCYFELLKKVKHMVEVNKDIERRKCK